MSANTRFVAFSLHGGHTQDSDSKNQAVAQWSEQHPKVSRENYLGLINHGDARGLITHPPNTARRQLSASEREPIGVTVELIRLSAGLENTDHLLEDLDQALAKA
jgi:O-acetylhomoserine/O-acetylserine sulfhydrylase-like pyridoxal-dependent enzyme